MRQGMRAIFLAAAIAWAHQGTTEPVDDPVWLVDLTGPVGPASVDLVIRTIDDANESHREAVIIRMDTPGGLDKAMRDLVRAILASDVPIITFVAPNGARAASAGTFITYASHVAAMAPATNIGSSTPVSIAHVCAGKIRAAQLGPAQIRSLHIRTGQHRPTTSASRRY